VFDDFHISIAAEELFSIGPWPITNSYITSLIVMAALILVGIWVNRKPQDIPGRFQGVCEMIVEYLLDLTEIAGGRKLARMTFPLVGSIFIFVITANYAGLLPVVGSIGYYHNEPVEEGAAAVDQEPAPYIVASTESLGQIQQAESGSDEADHGETERILVPFLRAPNADLNQTLAMALISWLTAQILGSYLAGGFGRRLKHMAEPKLLFPIELLSEFAKILSLTARLFGNVFAGEVILLLLYTVANGLRFLIIPFAFPIVFLMLELLFGFIQAILFALLTLIYIRVAAGTHDDDHAVDDAHVEFPEATLSRLAQEGRP
jgi:F-type H+-transporting ATPase subunit a